MFYLPDENGPKTGSTSYREYNDWKKRLQRNKSSRNFKVRGSVPGVRHQGAPNALPHPDPEASMTNKNCSIISGHFELELVPIRISGDNIARPEPVYQMQWLPVPPPLPQFLSNNCNQHPAVYYNPSYNVYNQGVSLCHTSGNFFNGLQYPGGYYGCGGEGVSPKPNFVMCDYAAPQYNYPVASSGGQCYYQYSPSAFIACAASRCAANSNLYPNLYPNYVPVRVQGGHPMYGIQPQTAFPQVMMTF